MKYILIVLFLNAAGEPTGVGGIALESKVFETRFDCEWVANRELPENVKHICVMVSK